MDICVRLREWCGEAIPIWASMNTAAAWPPSLKPSGHWKEEPDAQGEPAALPDIEFSAMRPVEAKRCFVRVLQSVIFACIVLSKTAASRRDAAAVADTGRLAQLRDKERHYCELAKDALDLALRAVEKVDPSHKPRAGRAPRDIAAELLPVLSRLRGLLAINHAPPGIDKYTEETAGIVDSVCRLRFELHTLMFDDPGIPADKPDPDRFLASLEELLAKHGLTGLGDRLSQLQPPVESRRYRRVNKDEDNRTVSQYIRSLREKGTPIEEISRDRIAQQTGIPKGGVSHTPAWKALSKEKELARIKTRPETAGDPVAEAIERGDWDAVERAQADEEENPGRFD
jgi:hypothetical protein